MNVAGVHCAPNPLHGTTIAVHDFSGENERRRQLRASRSALDTLRAVNPRAYEELLLATIRGGAPVTPRDVRRK